MNLPVESQPNIPVSCRTSLAFEAIQIEISGTDGHIRSQVTGAMRGFSASLRVRTISSTPCSRNTKKARGVRDPNRPTGYISAFNFFVKDIRPKLLEDRPELLVGQGILAVGNKMARNIVVT